MTRKTRLTLALTTSAFALSACLSNDGKPMPRTTDGAVIGGIVGGLIGAGKRGKHKKKNVILGVAVGAAIGGLIGQQLDKQEKSLRKHMGNKKVKIVNTGKELIVTLPEAITFETDSAQVRTSLMGDLAALAKNLNKFPDTTVDIIGHTDNIGDAGYNQQLASQRAESVYLILENDGVAASRMRAIGRGESDPKSSNLTEEGRAKNRRVEVIIRPRG